MAKRFTFSTLGKNGKKYYPQKLIDDQSDLVSKLTENKEGEVKSITISDNSNIIG